ncbi:MAG: TetR family transcriptional regulator C-terminal domain-containing protein [Woeseiaceae bacterium]|jgi:AcrR family transcriptional regulator|nr:TetR family transcriptional regulator C-terminal domain-containing protein [Woeseiaceae bacterium]
MPKLVDHEAQRQRFAEATMRLVARSGLEAVTMRAVAREAGLSYGSLFHYFESKDDLLMHAVRHSMALQTRRVNEFQDRYAGLAALEQLLCDDAITDEISRDAWMVWLTFLYKAAKQPEYARVHAELIDGWLGRFRRLLADAQLAGEIAADLDIEFEARALWVYSAGIGQMGLIDPERLPPDTQKQLITGYLDKLRRR